MALLKGEKGMNLDYITINGLDANTKKRIEEDLAKGGYTGSKSAYVTALMNDGLDKREAIRGVTSEKDFQSLYAKASAIEEKLSEVSSREYESGSGMEVYKILAVKTYRLLELLADSMGLDHGGRAYRLVQLADGLLQDAPRMRFLREAIEPQILAEREELREDDLAVHGLRQRRQAHLPQQQRDPGGRDRKRLRGCLQPGRRIRFDVP